MSTAEIAKQIRVFSGTKGKPEEVLIPYSLFVELMELKVSMDVYNQKDVQSSLRRAKKELKEGKTNSFTSISEALRWLKK